MNTKDIKDFIQIAKDEGVSELKYEGEDIKISVSFNSSASVMSRPSGQIQISPIAEPIELSGSSNSEKYYEVKSPLVGTFYNTSSPGKPSFVSVGEKISKGTTLCILEAMKIMNEIEIEVSGEIVEVCVENESLVEFDQVLFKVKV
jgi:acetyl-CoA carboxylase biotin carboxyl carrier protein